MLFRQSDDTLTRISERSPTFRGYVKGIGFIVAGAPGATAAALGIFLPVYLVVVLLAPSYKRWAKNPQLNRD
jgi:hypothetical protein